MLTLFVLWELHTDEPMLDMRYFRNPAFSMGSGGMMLVFLAMYGVMFLMTQYFQLVLGFSALGAALRLLPIAVIMLVVTPFTPRIVHRFGANRVGRLRHGADRARVLAVHAARPRTRRSGTAGCASSPLMTGVSMSMSPMTASIMSAVPESRAGAGSAMNDATRELGAALGIAVLGSIAASQYSSHLHDALEAIPAAARGAASSSIAGALQVAEKLPAARGRRVRAPRRRPPSSTASTSPRSSASSSRSSPRSSPAGSSPAAVADVGPMHSAVEALENAAEFGIGGAMPVFPDASEGPDEARVRSTA